MLVGEKLGRYEIRAKIGSGGMGEVFLARDSQLERDVALKVLLPEFCRNEERSARFKLEARAASALNHPSIITIHEIGEAEERLFIATEFVDGITLREKIQKNELSKLDALKIAEQIADALTVAHAAGIVHRDIKPENIMIRRDRIVKILDFGLVKPRVKAPSGDDDDTQKLVRTEPGLVMGSVRYMSPEQARGKAVDERTDVWSLGVVLYEMLSGKNPFEGETVSDSLAAVIHVEPPALEGVSPALDSIVRRAICKKIEDRYSSVKKMADDLRHLRLQIEHDSAESRIYTEIPRHTANRDQQDTSENKTLIHRTNSEDNRTDEQQTEARKTQVYAAASASGVRRSFLPVGVLALAGALAFGAWYYQPFETSRPAAKFETMQLSRLTENGRSAAPAISPDGKTIAYVSSEGGMRTLMVRQTAGGGSVQVVPPTNLGFYAPVFAPDGTSIFYTTVDRGIGTLYQIPTLGGVPKRIIVDVDSKIALSDDGKRLAFIRQNPQNGTSMIVVANNDGTNPQELVSTRELNYSKFSDVAWIPGEDKLLVGAVDRIYKEDLLGTNLIVVSLADKRVENFGEKKWLNANSFGWQKDKSGVYFVGKSNEEEPAQVWFLSYPEAESRQVTNDSSGYAMMSYAPESDAIITSKKDAISSLWSYQPQTKELTQITGESRNLHGAAGVVQMPDGNLLYTKTEGTRVNLYRADEDGRNETALTAEDGYNVHPVPTPGGRYIVFCSNRTGSFRIWRMDADGKNPVQITSGEEGMDLRPQVLKDGRTIVFERGFEDQHKSKIMKTSIDGGEPAPLFSESPTNDFFPSLSADGKTLAFMSQLFDEQAFQFKHALKFSPVAENGEISAPNKEINLNLGWNYQWAANGKALTYVNPQGVPNVFNLPLDGGEPKQLTSFNSGTIMNFDWSRDGKRLFIVRGVVNSDLILIRDNSKTAL